MSNNQAFSSEIDKHAWLFSHHKFEHLHEDHLINHFIQHDAE